MHTQTKTRFKKTPLSEIPEGWEVIKIKDVIKEAKPGFASGKRDENGIIQLRMNNITTEGKVTLKEYLEVPVRSNIEDYLLKPGDVLFNNTNSVDLIGKTAIFRGECEFCTYSNHITRIRVDSSRVIPEWIMYYFMELWRIGYFRQICVRYVGQASIKKADLLNIPLPLPPLPGQRKIAEILRTVDEAIEKTDKAIERTERLKKGLMQRLLTKGIKHERFKKTELGEIPEEWRVVKVEDIITEAKPGFASGKRDENGIIQLRMNNITTDGRVVLDQYLKVPIPKNKNINDYLLRPGDVLFNNTNSVDLLGKSAVFRGECEFCTYSNHITRIRVKNDVTIPEWLVYNFIRLWQIQYFKQIAIRHVGQAGIRKSDLLNIRLPLPPLEEQKQIAEILSTVDRRLKLLRKRREKLERVKRGLMKDLLTGRRVNCVD
ncbi:hypothetical protein APY94_03385 [Thermococcus celericrescens]|uniref:Type I restriction modification DNA specificity domain-containing protein n=1 Tax=Thermococcus celericrescens TaxID=227598 RepID=A0A100XYQ2_9EURY|nr:restriction endonuclease subunit S [Thermococcus celericrescens]KUH34118.1 hypothetical protein APY94_03385 [Thermococcus celericrescens]